jgi:Glycosyl hydrolase family 3 N terminal domain
VARVYGRLTLAQRVGELFLVGVTSDIAGPQTTAAVSTYHFGSLLLNPTAEGVTALAAATAHMQSLAAANDGVRFFIAANQEGGEIQQLTGPGFATMPSALTQGTWPAATLRSVAAGWGSELKAAGVNLNLAPVMDVVPAATASQNAPVGALDREFGYTPAGNGAHGAAFIAGMGSAGVATAAKHFPGLGQVTGNTDFTADVVPRGGGGGRAVRHGGGGHVHADRRVGTRRVLAGGHAAAAVWFGAGARVRRCDHVRRHRRRDRGAVDPGGDARDLVPDRGRRHDHLSVAAAGGDDGGGGAGEGVIVRVVPGGGGRRRAADPGREAGLRPAAVLTSGRG